MQPADLIGSVEWDRGTELSVPGRLSYVVRLAPRDTSELTIELADEIKAELTEPNPAFGYT